MPGGPLLNPAPGQTGDPVVRFHSDAVNRASRKYGIPKTVLYAILRQEGGTSPAGRPVRPADGAGPPSFGQFTFETGKSLGVKYGDSDSEVDAIGRYLTQLGWRKGERPDSPANKKAIGSYNGGPANPQYDYAEKVLKTARHYGGVGTPLGDAAGAIGGAVGGVVDTATAIPEFVGKLGVIFDGAWWLRVGMILGGIVALTAALVFIGKDFTPVGAVMKYAKRGA